MNLEKFMTQRNIIIILGALLLGILIVIIWQSVTLRIVSVSPSVTNVSNSEPFFAITLNHDVEKAEGVMVNDVESSYEIVEGKTIRVSLENLNDDADNELKIAMITARGGKQLKNISFTLKSHYVDFTDMSEEAQQESINQSHSGQSSDPFLTKNAFPLDREGYVIRDETIDYQYPILDVTFDEEIAPGPDAPRPQVSNERALALQKDLFDFIRAQGGKLDTYYIRYSNNYLNSLTPVGD